MLDMKIALGISGGVAAYKAAELVRRLQDEHFDVQVIMTRNAREFVTPLTFAALTGQKVITKMFGDDAAEPANVESAIEHIAVAQGIDLLLIAPATADILAKLARGIADDFLTTLYLATTAPVLVAPAMNVNMWDHAATQDNLQILRARGAHIVEPDEGYLACGMIGAGRLAGAEAIIAAVRSTLKIQRDLDGETVLITAGPTCEDLDPVRYFTNRSSGKMGYAIAESAARRGARVILVSGPTFLEKPGGTERILVRSAEEMRRAVLEHLSDSTVVIAAAAVADYRPVAPRTTKMKRDKNRLTLELEATPDILAEVARDKGQRILVGFAAETDHLAENARAKLEKKGVDLIVANDVTQRGAGFDIDTNVVSFFARDSQQISLPPMSKFEVAGCVLDQVLRLKEVSRRAHASREAAV